MQRLSVSSLSIFRFYVMQGIALMAIFTMMIYSLIPVFMTFPTVHSCCGGMLLSLLAAQLLCAVGVLQAVFTNRV